MLPAMGDSDGLSPLTTAFVVSLGLLLARYFYLRSQRTRNMAGPPPSLPVPTGTALPSHRSWRWPNRKERLERETEFVRTHTNYILSRIEEAKAIGGLAQARKELADILASLEALALPLPATTGASVANPSLSLQEIEEIVDALPDVSPELRRLLMRLLAGRMAEKGAP